MVPPQAESEAETRAPAASLGRWRASLRARSPERGGVL